MIARLDERAVAGTTVAVTRNPAIYPFAFVGYPGLDHPLVYADTLTEASARGADWAVLPGTATDACPGWRTRSEVAAVGCLSPRSERSVRTPDRTRQSG